MVASVAPSIPRRAECLRLAYVYGATVFYRPGETLGPRVLPDYELVAILEGNVTYRLAGRDHAAAPGAMILARPGFEESYRWDPAHNTRHAYFHFGVEAIPRGWPPPSQWPAVIRRPDALCPALFERVVRLCASRPRWLTRRPTREACSLIETLIGLLLLGSGPGAGAPGCARPPAVQRALQWMRQVIDEEPDRSLLLDDVAAEAHVSGKHLCRLFRGSIGCGPMEAWRMMRLQLALVLLSRSNLTVKQVACRCGFSSQFQFSRCFSKAFGRPPTEMRRRALRGGSLPAMPLPADVMPRVFW